MFYHCGDWKAPLLLNSLYLNGLCESKVLITQCEKTLLYVKVLQNVTQVKACEYSHENVLKVLKVKVKHQEKCPL